MMLPRLTLAILTSLALSCGASRPGSDGGPGQAADLAPRCSGAGCNFVDCQQQGKPNTSLSGVVNIPAGNLPLYNALVYVPSGPVPPFTDGPSCDRCADQPTGDALASTRTDVNGKFTLPDVPAGDVPLVVSIGKWRRQVTLANIPACTNTAVDPEMTRLPKNRGEGDIPKIALSTGGYDAIECLLRKIGIDDAEFTPETAAGRVTLLAGDGGTDSYQPPLNNGAMFTYSIDQPLLNKPGWWSNYENMKTYDIIILSCEGSPNLGEKSMAARAAMQQFIDNGGRIFASHWHNVWIADGPAPMSTVAQMYGADQIVPLWTAEIDQSFAGGMAFEQWLVDVGASSPAGTLQILNPRHTIKSIVPTLTQRYVYYANPQSPMTGDAQYFTFNAPVGAAADQQCGRMVFTDMHVSGNDASDPTPGLDLSDPGLPFPTGCVTSDLSAQEKALIFLLFDLSSCVQPILG